MNEQDPISTDDWLQIYQQQQGRQQQQQQQQQRQTTTTSQAATPPSGGSQPRVSGAKPVRKRSRGSNKAPATLLNASPINFRALVQQFTGCSSSSSSNPTNTAPFGKGPLNINFGGPTPEDRDGEISSFAQYNSTQATSLSQSQHDNTQLIGSADPPNTGPPAKYGIDEFDASLQEFAEGTSFDRGSGNDDYFF